jgi:hypothetical protein
MDHDKRGRVVGVIHTQRRPPGGLPAPAVFYPQPLRLVARPDSDMARMIENALALFALRGHAAAIDYLTQKKVPLRTISRVLWKPQQRRASGD